MHDEDAQWVKTSRINILVWFEVLKLTNLLINFMQIKIIKPKIEFITIKDYNKDLPNKLNCRLFNFFIYPFKIFTKFNLGLKNKTAISTKLNQCKKKQTML